MPSKPEEVGGNGRETSDQSSSDVVGLKSNIIDAVEENEYSSSSHIFPEVFEKSTVYDSNYDDNLSDTDQEVSFWMDGDQRQQEKRLLLNEAIANISDGKVSPIASVLNSPWQNISRTQKSYYIRKVRQAFQAVLSTVVPEQENEVLQEVLNQCVDAEPGNDVDKDNIVDKKELSILLAAFNEAESRQTRLQILSLFAKHFTKKELREMVPGLSNWQIDQARRHAVKEGPGKLVISTPIKRTRLDPHKTNHFVNFLSRPNFLQDVAFGTKTLKLDTGEQITIPNVIRTMVPSRIIKQYVSFCQDTGFEPASERTLFRIIEVCAASNQKSLQGLDYFSTEGAEAFDTLYNAVSVLEENGATSIWAMEMKNALRDCKRYLKTDYKSHVGPNEKCLDHCTNYSLSDPLETAYAKDCKHRHDTPCSMCTKLDESLLSITKMITSTQVHLTPEQQNNLRFDVKHAVESIFCWKAHLIRTVNQEQAKEDILQSLDDNSIFIVMDWAMKYLPKRYREQMSDFYGKRGKSWHVSCIIYKSGDSYEVETIVHIFDSCTQDWFSVLSILENLLATIKQEHPSVNVAYLKSNNAGCYHNGMLLLSLKSMGERTGICIKRYDYSDPQSGKDVCDRKIAPLKGHIQRWINENHDVLSAADMKNALESHGGVRGCRFLVAEVDMSKAAEMEKWKGISSLFSFEFGTSSIKAWKAYGIGKGKEFTDKGKLSVSKQGSTNLRVILPISPMTQLTRPASSRKKVAKNDQNIFMCLEEGCVATFQHQKDMEDHMDTGQHVRVMERETVYDLARKRWAENVTGVQSSHVGETGGGIDNANLKSQKQPDKGWALKSTKKSENATENVKLYLIEAFNKGIRTGNQNIF